MKLKHPMVIFAVFFLLICNAAAADPRREESEPWWQVELTMSVSGSYHYKNDGLTHDGKFSFDILLEAAMEYDMSKDFLLYGGESKITTVNWKEVVYTEDGGLNTADMSRTVNPVARLNYVLKERRELCFDLEAFLKTPIMEVSDPFKKFLLPRSELNKTINRKDKYNKNITGGTNKICMPEKLILTQPETLKSFNWQWKRKRDDFLNLHSVELKIKITRKEK
jgi:hypothetical protein